MALRRDEAVAEKEAEEASQQEAWGHNHLTSTPIIIHFAEFHLKNDKNSSDGKEDGECWFIWKGQVERYRQRYNGERNEGTEVVSILT